MSRFGKPVGKLLLLQALPGELLAFASSGKQLAPLATFPATQDGHARFAAFLAERQAAEFLLLADTGDENALPGTIPCLHGRDRTRLIQRKLDARFPETPFRTSASLGKPKGGAKLEKILFSSLTRPGLLSPWLDCLGQAASSLVGIYAPGQLDGHILGAISGKRATSLLVTCDEESIRQSLFIGGRRHFSRTSRLATGSPDDQAHLIREEAERLTQYLATQDILPPGDRPKRIFVAPPDIARVLAAMHGSEGATSDQVADRAEIAEACGLGQNMPWRQASLALLARQRPKEQFAPPELLATRRHRRLAGALVALAIGLLLAGTAFSAWTWFEAGALVRQTQALRHQADEWRARYAEIAKTFPKQETAPEIVRALIDDHRAMLSRRQSMADLLIPLGAELTKTPAIQLNRITWQAADPDLPGLVIEGTIAGGGRSYRQAEEEFNTLVARLRSQPGIAATVVAAPLEFSSNGDSPRDGTEPLALPFKLRVDQRPRS